MAFYYNKNHKLISFDVGQMIYVCLSGSMEPGYHLPMEAFHKLSQQRVGPFKVVERIGQLAYRLDLPPTWKIHDVLSVAHLEPYVLDTFERTVENAPPQIGVGHDRDPDEEWEIEDVIRDRYNKRRKHREYYVKWCNFGPEHNTWEPEENLFNAPYVLENYRNRDTITTVASTFFLPSPDVIPQYSGSLVLSC